MLRINVPTKVPDLFGPGKPGFRDGDMATNTKPTDFDAAWCNHIQEELATVIESAGLTLNPASYSQLLEAIKRMIDIQSGNYALDTGVANAYVIALDPAINAYTDGMTVRFRVAHGNNSASTLDAGAGPAPLVNDVAGALVNGDLPTGCIVSATYDGTAAKWLINSLVTSQALSQAAADALYAPMSAPIPGHIKNLVASSLGVNNYNCAITADKAVLENGGGKYIGIEAINLTINANGTVGAPLSSMSALAINTWYYRWLWYNATAGITATLDTSSTAPTPPTGYVAGDYKALLPGACRTDGTANKYLLQLVTKDNVSAYVVLSGSNTAYMPQMASGSAGNPTVSPSVAIATGAFVPPTAKAIDVFAFQSAGGSGNMTVAPNASYGGCATPPNVPPISLNGGATYATSGNARMQLESSNIYWASNGPAGNYVACRGWLD